MNKRDKDKTESFSSRIKSELAGLRIRRFDDARALLCAFTLGIGTLRFVSEKRSWGVHYSLKSRPAMELCAKLITQHYKLDCELLEVAHERLRARNCELLATGDGIESFMRSVGLLNIDENGESSFTPSVPGDILFTDTGMRCFIRGLFLACGMVFDPKKAYRAELVLNNASLADKAAAILTRHGIAPNRSARKGSIVLYIKEGGKLEDLLAFIGASEAMMLVSNERILREAKNRANRYVNCSTANANRITDTAKKQAADIELVLKTLGAGALSEELRVVAEARLDNFELSLSELADELDMGRSAVNYRLKKLEKLANEIRGKGNEE